MGSNEWYSPEYLIEAARNSMGSIDLDPASCVFANKIVKATDIFTLTNSGLDKDWCGNVWLNPPYDTANLKLFLKKAEEQILGGKVNNMIMLLNATVFENTLIYALKFNHLCLFPVKRIKFYNDQGKSNTNRFGNVILGYGDTAFKQRFYHEFRKLGIIYKQIGKK